MYLKNEIYVGVYWLASSVSGLLAGRAFLWQKKLSVSRKRLIMLEENCCQWKTLTGYKLFFFSSTYIKQRALLWHCNPTCKACQPPVDAWSSLSITADYQTIDRPGSPAVGMFVWTTQGIILLQAVFQIIFFCTVVDIFSLWSCVETIVPAWNTVPSLEAAGIIHGGDWQLCRKVCFLAIIGNCFPWQSKILWYQSPGSAVFLFHLLHFMTITMVYIRYGQLPSCSTLGCHTLVYWYKGQKCILTCTPTGQALVTPALGA